MFSVFRDDGNEVNAALQVADVDFIRILNRFYQLAGSIKNLKTFNGCAFYSNEIQCGVGIYRYFSGWFALVKADKFRFYEIGELAPIFRIPVILYRSLGNIHRDVSIDLLEGVFLAFQSR